MYLQLNYSIYAVLLQSVYGMCFLILVFKLPSAAAAAAAHFKEKVSSDVRTTQAPPGEAELTHHTH